MLLAGYQTWQQATKADSRLSELSAVFQNCQEPIRHVSRLSGISANYRS